MYLCIEHTVMLRKYILRKHILCAYIIHVLYVYMGGVVAEWIGHSAFSAVVAGSNPSGSG